MILLIEDERDIADLVSYHLRQAGYTVACAARLRDGIAQALATPPELIILDLMLPDGSGLDGCRTLKNNPQTRHVPIVILTARGEEIDRVVGFEVGADDYLTKPFSPRELTLRVRAILRRHGDDRDAAAPTLSAGRLRVDTNAHQVFVDDRLVHVTAIEFKLLHYFLSNRGRVATRDTLLDRVWGYEAALTTRTVDTHMKRLREKLGPAGDAIETVRGVGYRFVGGE
ncbi:MAG: response regulator transcription factor [Deltaproteobacteria bacterium]|nr:response regulator transcription factor [Deltaproteobacteria bacterium]